MKQELRVNPELFEQAKMNMSPEDIEKYKQIGEQMYNTMDFTAEKPDLDYQITESVAYILEALKSGMHPSYLTEEEVEIMDKYGEKNWRKKYEKIFK